MYKKKFIYVIYIVLCNYIKISKFYICFMSKMFIFSLFGLIYYCEMSFIDMGMVRFFFRLLYSLYVLIYIYVYCV